MHFAGMGGMQGMPKMSEQEMLQATLEGAGPRKVSPGKVRRKRTGGSSRMRELQELSSR